MRVNKILVLAFTLLLICQPVNAFSLSKFARHVGQAVAVVTIAAGGAYALHNSGPTVGQVYLQDQQLQYGQQQLEYQQLQQQQAQAMQQIQQTNQQFAPYINQYGH